MRATQLTDATVRIANEIILLPTTINPVRYGTISFARNLLMKQIKSNENVFWIVFFADENEEALWKASFLYI